MIELTKEQAEQIGREVAAMFGLALKSNGRYDTNWGDKTLEGIGRCIHRISTAH